MLNKDEGNLQEIHCFDMQTLHYTEACVCVCLCVLLFVFACVCFLTDLITITFQKIHSTNKITKHLSDCGLTAKSDLKELAETCEHSTFCP